jgi:hypothetical protein
LVLAGGDDVSIGVSIGISVFPIDASDPESAMRHGDRSSTKPKPPAEERVDFTTRTLQGEKGEGL